MNVAAMRVENAPRPRFWTSHLITQPCIYMRTQPPNKNAVLVSENECHTHARRKCASTPASGHHTSSSYLVAICATSPPLLIAPNDCFFFKITMQGSEYKRVRHNFPQKQPMGTTAHQNTAAVAAVVAALIIAPND